MEAILKDPFFMDKSVNNKIEVAGSSKGIKEDLKMKMKSFYFLG